MTKPVAYLVNGVAFNDIDRAKFYSDVLKYHKKIDIESLVPIPLYTAEQLHPRVKMTQAEFDEFNEYYERLNKLNSLEMLDRYFNFGDIPLLLNSDKFILPIANIWDNFDTEHPEETIEIVPDMKWFVRSKKSTTKGEFRWLDNNQSDNIIPTYLLSVSPFNSHAFDTKKEAEKWTNPLTEAVHLPVEEE